MQLGLSGGFLRPATRSRSSIVNFNLATVYDERVESIFSFVSVARVCKAYESEAFGTSLVKYNFCLEDGAEDREHVGKVFPSVAEGNVADV